MRDRIKNLWLSTSLKNKIGIFAAAVILVMGLAAAFTVSIVNFSLGSFNEILDDNSRCHDFQEAMDLEIQAFEKYIRDRGEETHEEYVTACVRTERCISSLPFDYRRIGENRYARTWNVKNGYEGYRALRDEVAAMRTGELDFVRNLSKVYRMQEYLQEYASRLVSVTLEAGNESYQEKVPVFVNMPLMILVASAAMMIVVLFLTKLLSDTLVRPLVVMAQSVGNMAKNDFGGQELSVSNKDEMGDLVHAFNQMKLVTKNYISTLKANNEMAALLHQEELERVEMEKQLDAARLENLKNQINPHFLFNTLNMIACSAKLEEAATTERMITSMSNLFRYNLKTSEQVVSLAGELKVVRDYMYIQQMRFGDRIRYEEEIDADEETVRIPAFTLQPVVENAIIHGIGKKEEGGTIRLRVLDGVDRVIISVADDGLGMGPEKLEALREALKGTGTARVGIGLGNIYRRLQMMYEDADFKIESSENGGTVVWMEIPQRVKRTGEDDNVSIADRG